MAYTLVYVRPFVVSRIARSQAICATPRSTRRSFVALHRHHEPDSDSDALARSKELLKGAKSGPSCRMPINVMQSAEYWLCDDLAFGLP